MAAPVAAIVYYLKQQQLIKDIEMFQPGSKFVSKSDPKLVWTVTEVVNQGTSFKGKLPDGTERLFAKDQMVSISQSAGHKRGSF